MSLDMKEIIQSKSAFRRELAGRSVAMKLRMLETLRDRLLAIRPGALFARLAAFPTRKGASEPRA